MDDILLSNNYKMTNKNKFNSLLEFFIKQWEENAANEGASGENTKYGNTWSGSGYSKFTNYGFSEDWVEINSFELGFSFGSGFLFEQKGMNFVCWSWLNIVPNILKGVRKITALSTVAVQTPNDNTPIEWLQFKESLSEDDYCTIPVDSSKSPIISQKDLDRLYENFFQLIEKFFFFNKLQEMGNIIKLLQANKNLILTCYISQHR